MTVAPPERGGDCGGAVVVPNFVAESGAVPEDVGSLVTVGGVVQDTVLFVGSAPLVDLVEMMTMPPWATDAVAVALPLTLLSSTRVLWTPARAMPIPEAGGPELLWQDMLLAQTWLSVMR